MKPDEITVVSTGGISCNKFEKIPPPGSDNEEKDGLKKILNNIKKSEVDDREYRYIRLQNSINCILVHDKDIEKSAACLMVGAGSLLDPHPMQGREKIDGLAHFCEHMLFLGTKKYPTEN